MYSSYLAMSISNTTSRSAWSAFALQDSHVSLDSKGKSDSITVILGFGSDLAIFLFFVASSLVNKYYVVGNKHWLTLVKEPICSFFQ